MKLLLSAYACEPGRGSEPGIGWNWAQQIARFHEVWVLTQEEGRKGIKATLTSEALSRVRFVYLDLPPWALFWKRSRRGAQLHYFVWQAAAYFAGRRLHRDVGFDLIHHVTLGKYWMPSFLALLPVPFIWGPVGGGESAPRSFWGSFSLRGKLFEIARDLARKMGECDPFVRHTARKARFGLATSEETAERLRILGCRRVSVLSQVGLPPDEIERLSTIPLRQCGPFRLVSIGNLLHWKGFELGIRAFAILRREFPTAEYWIFGDGPERDRLRKVAQKLGVGGSVAFWGAIPRRDVMERLGECDVLVHPSLHDSGGWVCLEAMAAGRPVVCLDLGGPALLVTEATGTKVPATSPGQVVSDLAAAFSRIASDPELRARLSLGGRKRVEEQFDWGKKGPFLIELYAGLPVHDRRGDGDRT
jgi:glycosyltransferase involved in cell wall biosynthesis